MRKSTLLVMLFTTSLLSGCLVQSFYPLYTEKELIRDDRIIGQWQSEDNMGENDTLIWKIDLKDKKWKKKQNNLYDRGSKKIPNFYTYTLNIHPKNNPKDNAEFRLHLVRLKDNIYIDLFPEDYKITNTIFAFHLVFTHSFAKVNFSDNISLKWFNSEWLQDLIEKNKIRIKHEKNSAFTLLTAKPKELQKFVIKYGNDPKAYDGGLEQILCRIDNNESISDTGKR